MQKPGTGVNPSGFFRFLGILPFLMPDYFLSMTFLAASAMCSASIP
jgi:hypothetical protein